MAQICLSDFMDFVARSGPSKLTKVRQLKRRPPYQPGLDYYRPLREAIVAVHRQGASRDALTDALAESLAAPLSQAQLHRLPMVAQGYRQWWGRKAIGWFDPPRSFWREGDLSVLVNPDLGLQVDGQTRVIKLYFKEAPLEKRTVDVVLQLMASGLHDLWPDGSVPGILDVRRGRLLEPTVDKPGVDAWLHGEVAFLAAAWGDV